MNLITKILLVFVLCIGIMLPSFIEDMLFKSLYEYEFQEDFIEVVYAIEYSVTAIVVIVLSFFILLRDFKQRTKQLRIELAKKLESKGFSSTVNLYSPGEMRKAYKAGLLQQKKKAFYDRLNNSKSKKKEYNIIANEWWQNNEKSFRPSYQARG